jgi:hypothetical protein
LSDFYQLCTAINAKPRQGLNPLELELLELSEFRSYVGGGGSISYFIENSDAKPSRLASLFTKLGPPQLAAMVRDSSKIFPDEMPSSFSEMQAFVEQRFANLGKLDLESLRRLDSMQSTPTSANQKRMRSSLQRWLFMADLRPNPSVKGTSCAKAQAAPYVER